MELHAGIPPVRFSESKSIKLKLKTIELEEAISDWKISPFQQKLTYKKEKWRNKLPTTPTIPIPNLWSIKTER